MPRLALVVLLLALGPLAASAQADTTLTVEGFLQADDQGGGWTLVVPASITAFHVRTFTLPLAPPAGRWHDLRNFYVAAHGRVSRTADPTPQLVLAVEDMRETTPPGTVDRVFDGGLGLRSRATLSVVPNRFAWEDAHGRPSGVNPLVLYTMVSERANGVEVIRPAEAEFCVRVFNAQSVPTWDTTFLMERTDARRFEPEGGSFREGVQLPRIAARTPGHYTLLAGVCETATFNLRAAFDVAP
jgi:hypothetical protein